MLVYGCEVCVSTYDYDESICPDCGRVMQEYDDDGEPNVQRNEEIRIMQEQQYQIVFIDEQELEDDDDYFVVLDEKDLMVNDITSYIE